MGPELEAIRNKFPDRLILVSPSFPSMERILLDGWLRVRSSEGIEPIHLLSLLTGQGVRRLTHIPRPAGASDTLVERIQHAQAAGARIIVIDAVSETQLRAIAEAAVQIAPQPLLVGSAGLAAHWSELLLKAGNSGASGTTESAGLVSPVSDATASVSPAGPVVLCIGSTNAVTCQQLQRLADTQSVLTFDWRHDDPDHALAALARGCHLAVPIQRDSVNRKISCVCFPRLWKDLASEAYCAPAETLRGWCAPPWEFRQFSLAAKFCTGYLGGRCRWPSQRLADLHQGRRIREPRRALRSSEFSCGPTATDGESTGESR